MGGGGRVAPHCSALSSLGSVLHCQWLPRKHAVLYSDNALKRQLEATWPVMPGNRPYGICVPAPDM